MMLENNRGILIFLSLAVPAVLAEKFTIVVMPDTQTEMVETFRYANMVKWSSMVNWIKAKRDSLNVRFIAHVGDLVNWETPFSTPPQYQYQAASDGFSELETMTNLPYSIAVGNHDTRAVGGVNGDGTACWCSGAAGPGDVRANLRNTTTLNAFFPPSRYTAVRGSFEAGKTDNSYHIFTAGGVDWLVVSTELDPRPIALTWIDGVIAAHPNHNVIYVTHSYTAGSGGFAGPVGYGDLSPTQVWNNSLRRHANLRMVLSGHTCCNARRANVGDNGNTVHEMLTDWQGEGAGWFRLLEIDTQLRTIKATTYSDHLRQFKTDAQNQFTLTNVNFVQPIGTSVKPNPGFSRRGEYLRGMPFKNISLYNLKGIRVYSKNADKSSLKVIDADPRHHAGNRK